MLITYTDSNQTGMIVVLNSGESLGNFTGPITFHPGMSVGNKEYDTIVSLMNEGLITINPYIEPVVTQVSSISIISTSDPTLNSSYGVDNLAQQRASSVAVYIQVNGRFPANQSVQYWYDINGVIHLFKTIESFQAFATALADYAAEVDLNITPTSSVTIP